MAMFKCKQCNEMISVAKGHVDFVHVCNRKVKDDEVLDIDTPCYNLQGGDQYPFKRSETDKKKSTFKQGTAQIEYLRVEP